MPDRQTVTQTKFTVHANLERQAMFLIKSNIGYRQLLSVVSLLFSTTTVFFLCHKYRLAFEYQPSSPANNDYCSKIQRNRSNEWNIISVILCECDMCLHFAFSLLTLFLVLVFIQYYLLAKLDCDLCELPVRKPLLPNPLNEPKTRHQLLKVINSKLMGDILQTSRPISTQQQANTTPNPVREAAYNNQQNE